MDPASNRLHLVIETEEPLLRAVSEENSNFRAGDAASWSKKQELGHLIDSATNNRVRFVKAALEGQYTGPSYDGRGWVDLGDYAQTPWTDLVETWVVLNQRMAALLSRIPQDRLPSPCRIGNAQPVTLEFLIDDYILHMQHHLDHIVARQHLTEYPGAALGV